MWGNLVSLQLYPFAWLAHGAQKGKKKKKILAAQPTVAQLGRYLPTGTFVIWTFMVSNLMDGCQPWPLQRTQQSCSEG